MARSRAVVVATVLAAAPVLVAGLLGWWFGEQRRAATATYRVIEVIDGDTIVVARDGRTDTVRILGVDTPETKHPTKGVECFGPEASAYTTRRLLGARVRLEDDVVHRDVYGRRLSYVYVDGRSFDDELVRRGFARFLVIQPNVRHARDLLRSELDARRHHRGLWGAC